MLPNHMQLAPDSAPKSAGFGRRNEMFLAGEPIFTICLSSFPVTVILSVTHSFTPPVTSVYKKKQYVGTGSAFFPVTFPLLPPCCLYITIRGTCNRYFTVTVLYSLMRGGD